MERTGSVNSRGATFLRCLLTKAASADAITSRLCNGSTRHSILGQVIGVTRLFRLQLWSGFQRFLAIASQRRRLSGNRRAAYLSPSQSLVYATR